VGARSGVGGRIQQQIGKSGLAGFAIHHVVEHCGSFLSLNSLVDASNMRLARLAIWSEWSFGANAKRASESDFTSYFLTGLPDLMDDKSGTKFLSK
jgi:hypothetical protein